MSQVLDSPEAIKGEECVCVCVYIYIYICIYCIFFPTRSIQGSVVFFFILALFGLLAETHLTTP